jgi:hypothetical protein
MSRSSFHKANFENQESQNQDAGTGVLLLLLLAFCFFGIIVSIGWKIRDSYMDQAAPLKDIQAATPCVRGVLAEEVIGIGLTITRRSIADAESKCSFRMRSEEEEAARLDLLNKQRAALTTKK